MGGSPSTRRVVVEEIDGSGVVKISDSVVKRIRGQEGDYASDGTSSSSSSYSKPSQPSGGASSGGASHGRATSAGASYGAAASASGTASYGGTKACPRPPPTITGKDQATLKSIEACYMEKLKQLEHRNSELQKITNEQFVKAVQEVEKKFLKHSCSPVCQDLQTRVYECYLGNPRQTLNCSPQVREFSTCVDRARQDALLRKG